MSDSENYLPAAVRTPKRHRNEVDVSNVLPANAKKRRRSSSKKQADDDEKAQTEIKKVAKQLKKMKKAALKASNTPAEAEEEIDEFESEEEDEEEISSFPKSVRHIDTTVTPLRAILPAGHRHLDSPTPSRSMASSSRSLIHADCRRLASPAPSRSMVTPSRTLIRAVHRRSPSPTSPHSEVTAPRGLVPARHRYSADSDPDNQVFGNPTNDAPPSPTPPRSTQHIQAGPPLVAGWQNDIPPTGSHGARARDYNDEVYRLILKACVRYEVFIVVEQAFPSASEQTRFAQDFFREACEDIGREFEFTDRIATIIKARGSRIRGAIKSAARQMMLYPYGLLEKPCGDKGKSKNKIQAERYLEDDHFHYMYPDDGDFCFEHPLILKIFTQVFFGNKKSSIGIAYADYFNPLPLQTIALIVAAIGFCLRLYLNNGIVGDEQFSETAVKPFYDSYLSELKEWSAIEPVVTEKVRRKQFKRALRSAGASVQKVTGMSQEAKLRARMNLVGREVDMGSEDEDDRRMQSEEI
ncbi:hypothetical protein FIBSPDRAFT_1055595 [Athelia psychrophila]|uniref:DUF6532 domain-containing protein n=1 Tax=Athelia psychrophila TaxID=1759441 RepID=A0A167TF14_9AGAM|nr:hypothetical protein FIBSPDRAFT_1055595 [Fibularhizoctonia sp. CBS 109695]